MADIRKGAVTLKGGPVDLAGPQLKVGDAAPDFTLQGADLSDVTLAKSAGKARVIAVIPSLDTPTCHKETKLFNDKVKGLPNVQVLVVTHSPQVAARGGAHLLVSKQAGRGRTATRVEPLGPSARREEIARMLAGETVTEAARAAADALLGAAA